MRESLVDGVVQDNIRRKIIVVCQKYTLGEELVEALSASGLTKIPEPHTSDFFEFIPGSEFLKKLKGEKYIENFREALACNCDLEGFVTIVSKSFFNIAREHGGNKDKSEAMRIWLYIFGKEAKFIFVDTRNPFYRAAVKKNEDVANLPEVIREKLTSENISSVYKTHIRKDAENWSSNNFNSDQILKVFLEDLIYEEKTTWESIEDHIDMKVSKKSLGIDLERYEKQYRIAKESVNS